MTLDCKFTFLENSTTDELTVQIYIQKKDNSYIQLVKSNFTSSLKQ